LLLVDAVEKSFGGVQALSGCSFGVTRGSITALIGPNGSGKTTLFNCVTGFYTPDRGKAWFDGQRVSGRRPSEVTRMGVGRTFQVTRIFKRMTVLENVVVSVRHGDLRSLFRPGIEPHERERAETLLEFFGLARLRDEQAGRLSFGQQKLLELAGILMTDPALVLLDEPAGGLNPVVIDQVAEHVRALNGRGTTFLIIEHNMGFVMSLCDPIIVMHRGQVIAEGSPETVRSDARVLDAYLGD
jgi:neutral amino acid transport system ATP-binding protein